MTALQVEMPYDNAGPGPASGPGMQGTLDRFVTQGADGTAQIGFGVANMHCGGCVRKIEHRLAAVPGVLSARANLTARRVDVRFDHAVANAEDAAKALGGLGFEVRPFDPADRDDDARADERLLLRCLAVAGFATANVMLLSVAVWAGLFSADMAASTRDLLHWISAAIALPAVAYAGRPFFSSAVEALRAGRVNMDVPISLAVTLAAAMSLAETVQSGVHVFFDAAVSLLFFLLIGRYLERRVRSRARSAADELAALAAPEATVLDPDGRRRVVPAAELEPGDVVEVLPGDRVPADGEVVDGRALIDESFVTGETVPVAVQEGRTLRAGTVNLDSRLVVRVRAVGEKTLLAEIVRLLRQAEQGRSRYVRLADRLAAVYAPGVHAMAAVTFAGWLAVGADWQDALMAAVAVLIVTCPCALGLAVPVTQVVAAGRLFAHGVLVKAGDALERLAEIDVVVFDKTGTLSSGQLRLRDEGQSAGDRLLAARLGASSRHPLSRALAALVPDAAGLSNVEEIPGCGLCWHGAAGEVRLGSRSWCDVSADPDEADGPEVWLRHPDGRTVAFRFDDVMRPDAQATVRRLRADAGGGVVLLSGDRPGAVKAVARALSLSDYAAGLRPQDKSDRVRAMTGDGHKVLMVGDGINDAPALAFAHASMAPASGAEIAQSKADVVFRGQSLWPVAEAVLTARRARRVMLQNIALALAYNLVAVPLAMAGVVTPLIAAVAMSSSSLLVTLNALRLRLGEAAPDEVSR